uniref:Uncharacterized protein n=1 Tax=Brassica oleracea var. oleracea TaxID=109376 RepID=A0A0D3D8H0_BRAOL
MRDVIEDGDQVLIVLKHCNENLSTHEKELLKLQSKIDQMEKANLDPKHWTMQGEVPSHARFDDVQPAPSLPTKSKREVKELHDSKSKKGLAEVYEEEYVQKSNPLFAPSTFTDELKKEVIEEMSIQTNVPAIAMEEVAPVAVSDAAMLAPEEIFSGTGKIKEELELTQEERKRRRAKKKRKFKAESAKQPVKKARDTTSTEMSKT